MSWKSCTPVQRTLWLPGRNVKWIERWCFNVEFRTHLQTESTSKCRRLTNVVISRSIPFAFSKEIQRDINVDVRPWINAVSTYVCPLGMGKQCINYIPKWYLTAGYCKINLSTYTLFILYKIRNSIKDTTSDSKESLKNDVCVRKSKEKPK